MTLLIGPRSSYLLEPRVDVKNISTKENLEIEQLS